MASKSQIDKLGERLKLGGTTESDLRELDEYRRSFREPYEGVTELIRSRLGLEPTGRPAKSTQAIIDKLRRESVRLTQVQDIAGCRLVLANVSEQEAISRSLANLFSDVSLFDRRITPSHGYRAVHIVARIDGKAVEVQVRTELQHQWAEFSEKLSDVRDKTIKYGGGDPDSRAVLDLMSRTVAGFEQWEVTIRGLPDGEHKTRLMAQYNDQRERLLSTLGRLKMQISGGRSA